VLTRLPTINPTNVNVVPNGTTLMQTINSVNRVQPADAPLMQTIKLDNRVQPNTHFDENY